MQTLQKQLDEKFWERINSKTNPFTEENIEDYLHSRDIEIARGVIEKIKKENRDKDDTITMVVDTYMCGYNYRQGKIEEAAKQILNELEGGKI